MSRAALIAAAAVTALSLSVESARGDTFTSAQFLEWSHENQVSYFRTSIGMAGVIASQLDKAKARCIERWYEAENGRSYRTLLDAMQSYGTYHPQAIVLWMLQNECGDFAANGG